MAQVAPTANPGSLLLDKNAPYSLYLRALGNEWGEANLLEKLLQDARRVLDDQRALRRSQQPLGNWNLTAIIDICPGQIGNDVNVVAQLDKAQIQGEHLGTINQDAVDGFVDTLRHCATNIHTRIIVFQTFVFSQSDEELAIEALFHSHILGFELDLLPACVTRLSQMRKFRNGSSHTSISAPQSHGRMRRFWDFI